MRNLSYDVEIGKVSIFFTLLIGKKGFSIHLFFQFKRLGSIKLIAKNERQALQINEQRMLALEGFD